MREKMLEHRVRADCVQCHRMMDPIGFALENFDAIGLWRSHDEGSPIDASAQVFDNTMVDGPMALQQWVTRYSGQFVRVGIEKLDDVCARPRTRLPGHAAASAASRATSAPQDNRFSALVLAVRSKRAVPDEYENAETSRRDQ